VKLSVCAMVVFILFNYLLKDSSTSKVILGEIKETSEFRGATNSRDTFKN